MPDQPAVPGKVSGAADQHGRPSNPIKLWARQGTLSTLTHATHSGVPVYVTVPPLHPLSLLVAGPYEIV